MTFYYFDVSEVHLWYRVCIFHSPPKTKRDMVMVFVCPPICPSAHSSHFCPQHNSKTIQGIWMTLHKMIQDVKRKCSIQAPELFLAHFLNSLH